VAWYIEEWSTNFEVMVSEQDPERVKHIRSFRFVDEDIGVMVENRFNCLSGVFKKKMSAW
jgi:hypothetical protein